MKNTEIPKQILDLRYQKRVNQQHIQDPGSAYRSLCGESFNHHTAKVSVSGEVINVTLKIRESAYDRMKYQLCRGCAIKIMHKMELREIHIDGKKWKPSDSD